MKETLIKSIILMGFILLTQTFTITAVERNIPVSATSDAAYNSLIDQKDLAPKIETKKLTFREKFRIIRQIRKEMHQSKKSGTEVPMIVLFILAIFLPPVAVGIYTNWREPTLWNLLFTIIMWLPGIVHAFYVLLR
jgi:uncharacterized membrane protein YqaE (UPF0057 family)